MTRTFRSILVSVPFLLSGSCGEAGGIATQCCNDSQCMSFDVCDHEADAPCMERLLDGLELQPGDVVVETDDGVVSTPDDAVEIYEAFRTDGTCPFVVDITRQGSAKTHDYEVQ